MAKWVALTARKLKPGSFDDSRQAWDSGTPLKVSPRTSVATSTIRTRSSPSASSKRLPEQVQEMKPAEGAEEARTAAMAPHVESTGTDGFYEVIEEVTF